MTPQTLTRSRKKDADGLTLRQKDIYAYLVRYFLREQRLPMLHEISLAFHTKGVFRHMEALERLGLLKRNKSINRSWSLAGISLQLNTDTSAAGQLAQRVLEAQCRQS